MYQIRRIGLGTWPFGGEFWSHGWGEQDESISEEVTVEALKNGLNIIDTAPVYGFGRAELIIGNALNRWRGKQPFISTKCGQEWDNNGRFRNNLTPTFIRQGVHQSLQRLRIEHIDLLFLHYPSEDINETFAALEEMTKLKSEGKVKHIGISNFKESEIVSAAKNFEIYACQAKYSILDRMVEKYTLKICLEEGIKFYAYQPLESGLLTGSFFPVGKRVLSKHDWRSRSILYREEKLAKLNNLIAVLSRVAINNSTTITSISLSWVLQNQYCDVVLVGVRNSNQLTAIIDAVKIKLSEIERYEIDKALEIFKGAD